jgi:hypothetical protein
MSDNEEPGDGFRRVKPGETLQPGDQVFWRYSGTWENTRSPGSVLVGGEKLSYRRRVDVAAPSAGVQSVVVDMLNILVGNTADNDEKHAALVTLADALFPGQQNTVNRLSLSATKKELVSLQEFRVAVEHVTENGKTKRSMSSSDGWAVVHKDRLRDLEIAEERLAIAEERLAAAAISAEAAPPQACVTGVVDTRAWRRSDLYYRFMARAHDFALSTSGGQNGGHLNWLCEVVDDIVGSYAAPPAAGVTLTDAEREALRECADIAWSQLRSAEEGGDRETIARWTRRYAIIRLLLARAAAAAAKEVRDASVCS